MPRTACVQRTSASAPTTVPVVRSSFGWKLKCRSPLSIALRRSPSIDRRAGSAPIDLVAVDLDAESLRLGVEHRDVRVPQRSAFFDFVVDDGQTGARRDDDLETIERDRPADFVHTGPRQLEHLLSVVAGADDRELIAGESCEHVIGVDQRSESVTHHDEEVVAGVVTERVVHFLEPVEVEHDHEWLTVALAGGGTSMIDRSNDVRFGSPVSPSWRASRSIRWCRIPRRRLAVSCSVRFWS